MCSLQLRLQVLYEVLMTMTQLMSPFTPFFTESLYQHLRKYEVHVTYKYPRYDMQLSGF